MIKLTILVVLYEKTRLESKTLQSIVNQNNINGNEICITLNIYDNSEAPQLDNHDISFFNAFFQKVNYHHDGFNHPLSNIYTNELKNTQSDYLLVLDDDTALPEKYLYKFCMDLQKFGEKTVFVPKVVVNKKPFSPYHSWLFFSINASDRFAALNLDTYAINSGIFLPVSLLKHFDYPDYAKFYGTDTVLFEYINHRKIKITIMDVIVFHDLSFHPEADLDRYISSLLKVIAFWKAHYRKSFLKYLLLNVYTGFLIVKIFLKKHRFVNLFSAK
nr:glycosyltransferase class 2 [Aeromonas sobria]